MLAIRIDLLTGRYTATAYNDRDRAEWPPHPARLFSALVATWADGAPETRDGEAELLALRWLETLPPPVILASATDRIGRRTASTVFVPVNDVGVIAAPSRDKLDAAYQSLADAETPAARAKADKQLATLSQKLATDTARAVAVPTKFGKHDTAAAERSMIDHRMRQPRTFPSACPELPEFAFVWDSAEPTSVFSIALQRLARRLVRLGHSSSLVQARLVDELGELTSVVKFVPDDDDGNHVIRWVSPGQVDRLIRAHERYQQVEPRVLPAKFVPYREGESLPELEVHGSVFGDRDWIVYAHHRPDQAHLPITSTVGLSRQFRRALMSVADQPVDELISGHRSDSSPSETPHVAIVPLPFVTGPHPDGRLLGVLVALPRQVTTDGRQAVLRALANLERAAADTEPSRDDGRDSEADPIVKICLGDRPPLELARVAWQDALATLRSRSWARAARRWASATPVALDRNPGDLHDANPQARARAFDAARASIIESITRIGLPAPLEVDVVRSCVLPGTAKPRAFPRYPIDARKPQRVLVHVRLVFEQPIRGPVLIGAGRYHGLGLCAPLDKREES